MHLNMPRLMRGLLHEDVLPLVGRNAEKDDSVSTSVSYVYKTASKTFAGSAVYITLGLPSSTDDSSATTTSHHHHSSTQDAQTTPTQPTHSSADTTSDSQSTSAALLTASSQSSTPTAFDTSSQITSAASLTSADSGSFNTGSASSSSLDPAFAAGGSASTSSATPSASAKPDSGMSSGAKAGLSIAIILILGAIVGVVAFVYRKKKRQQEAGQKLDNEKGPMHHQNQANDFLMTAPPAPPVTYTETKKAPSVAPRLSLRPVTQLFGFGNPNRRSVGNPLDIGSGPDSMMAGAAGARSGASSPRGLRSAGQNAAMGGSAGPQSTSAWEKMGERDHASDPNNPFGDHAHSLNASPPGSAMQNPPDSPAKTDSLVLATGAAAGLAAAGAAAARSEQSAPPQQTSIVPKPLSIKSSRSLADGPVSPVSSSPVSPTKTESSEVPASAVAGGAAAAAAAAGAAGPGGPNNVHRVQMDFKPSMEDELELRAGQLVRMLHAYDDGWALCVRMDRSHQGVVPRTCLSTHPVKPRPPPNAQGPRGPPSNSPRNGPPGAAPRGPPPPGPPGGRNSPSPYGPPGRPMTPNGRNSPGPQGMGPMGPYSNQPRPSSPGMRGPPGPNGRARSGSVPRSMSPGPNGNGGRQQMNSGDSRRRSNSMSQLMSAAPGSRRNSPPGLSPLGQGQSNFSRPQRKPVPQAQ